MQTEILNYNSAAVTHQCIIDSTLKYDKKSNSLLSKIYKYTLIILHLNLQIYENSIIKMKI